MRLVIDHMSSLGPAQRSRKSDPRSAKPNGAKENGSTGASNFYDMDGNIHLSTESFQLTMKTFRLPASTPWLFQTKSSHFHRYTYENRNSGEPPTLGMFLLPRADTLTELL